MSLLFSKSFLQETQNQSTNSLTKSQRSRSMLISNSFKSSIVTNQNNILSSIFQKNQPCKLNNQTSFQIPLVQNNHNIEFKTPRYLSTRQQPTNFRQQIQINTTLRSQVQVFKMIDCNNYQVLFAQAIQNGMYDFLKKLYPIFKKEKAKSFKLDQKVLDNLSILFLKNHLNTRILRSENCILQKCAEEALTEYILEMQLIFGDFGLSIVREIEVIKYQNQQGGLCQFYINDSRISKQFLNDVNNAIICAISKD